MPMKADEKNSGHSSGLFSEIAGPGGNAQWVSK